jgi:DNA-binding CsgD family transcriptional regulator
MNMHSHPDGNSSLRTNPATIGDPIVSEFKLTQREAEVLRWLSIGKTNRDISHILGVSARTIDKHIERIFSKLGVETRTAAAMKFNAIQAMENVVWSGIDRRREDRRRNSR